MMHLSWCLFVGCECVSCIEVSCVELVSTSPLSLVGRRREAGRVFDIRAS